MIEVVVTIDAGIDKVWEMFVDLSRWHDWNTVLAIVSAGRGENISEGNSFTFVMRAFAFAGHLEPMAEEVLPFKRIILTGHRFGIRARHVFLFEGNETRTTVTSRETFSGITTVLPGWGLVQWRLKMLTGYMLRDLKNAAEAQRKEKEGIRNHRCSISETPVFSAEK